MRQALIFAAALAIAPAASVPAADDGHHPGHHGAQHHDMRHDSPPATDERQAIRLADSERTAVLAEMRVFLQSVQGVVSAVADGKPAAAAVAAKSSGMGATQGMPKSLMGKLPMEFRKLGMDTHQKFDALALEAEGIGEGKTLLRQLDAILANCNGCHAGFRFVAE